MSDDLLDRLRAFSGPYLGDGIHPNVTRDEIIAEIERLRADLASVHQAISDPENQPSQYGTVTLAMYERLRAERDALRAALTVIARTPSMPFPDPGAHSKRAYHQAVFRAWSQCNQTAYNALAQTGANDAGR